MTDLWSRVQAVLSRSKKPTTPDDHTQLDLNIVTSLNKKRIPGWQQLKQLSKILLPQEKRRALIAIALIIISGTGLLIQNYLRHTHVVPKTGGSYTEGLIGVPHYINPLLASNDVDRDLSSVIFSGLMKMDAKGQLVPDLAEGYTISDDKKTYTFKLRDGLRWHDGEPLTAEDVVYTLSVVQEPELKSPLRLSFSGVKVEALNDTTVKIQLAQVYAPFINSLTIGIIPKHIWYSIPATNAPLAEAMTKPIGSGPFKFKSLTKDSKSGSIKLYTLEANKLYYQHAPYISELNFKFYPDFESGTEALKNQNVNGLSLLPKDSPLQSAISKQTNILNLIVPQYTAVFINPDNNSALRDLKVRQALAYGLDRIQMLKDSGNDGNVIINSPILPGMIGYDANVKAYDYQPDQSKNLLDQAGWKIKENENYRYNKDDEPLELVLTTVDQPETVAVANLIKNYWEQLGVKTTVETISRTTILKDVIAPRSYQLLLFGQVIGASQDPYPFWHSSQIKAPGLNLSIFANRDIDAALDKARASDSEATKTEQYKLFQNKLQEQVFAFFLYNPSYSYPVAKNLKGTEQLTRINIPAERFADITNWYLKTSRSWSN